jgi:hypothetical protein
VFCVGIFFFFDNTGKKIPEKILPEIVFCTLDGFRIKKYFCFSEALVTRQWRIISSGWSFFEFLRAVSLPNTQWRALTEPWQKLGCVELAKSAWYWPRLP